MTDTVKDAPDTFIEGLYTLSQWTKRGVVRLARWVWLYILLGIILATVIIGTLEFFGVSTGIPYVLVDPIQVVAFSTVVGVIPAKLLVDKLLDWKYEDVYRVNSRLDPMVKHWYVGPVAWEEKTVSDGEVYSDDGGDNYYVRHFEQTKDGIEVTGPHRGELNDVELETFENAVEANRGTLRKWANIGKNLFAKFPAIAASVEQAYWQAMANQSLQDLTNHPDAVRSEVVADVDDMVDSIETPESPDAEELMQQAADEATDGALSDVTGAEGNDTDSDSTDSHNGGDEQ
jgi:hypothetical protein